MTARIHITLKKGILDAEGKAVLQALNNLGVDKVEEVRVGKVIELNFGHVQAQQARELAEQACQKLLANPVIEEYEIQLLNDDGGEK